MGALCIYSYYAIVRCTHNSRFLLKRFEQSPVGGLSSVSSLNMHVFLNSFCTGPKPRIVGTLQHNAMSVLGNDRESDAFGILKVWFCHSVQAILDPFGEWPPLLGSTP